VLSSDPTQFVIDLYRRISFSKVIKLCNNADKTVSPVHDKLQNNRENLFNAVDVSYKAGMLYEPDRISSRLSLKSILLFSFTSLLLHARLLLLFNKLYCIVLYRIVLWDNFRKLHANYPY